MHVKETTLYVPTSDGHLIALHYYAGYRGPMRRGPLPLPVLCVHGLGANRHNFDIFGDPGALPRQLAARGHDTYVVELRGMGHSHAEEHGVDDYLGLDLPAVVEYILQGRGLRQRKLHWVGHSLGAILGYLYGGHHPEQLASLTSVAGPLPAAVPIFARDLLVQARHLIRGGLEKFVLPNRRGAMAFKHLPKLARLAYDGMLFHGPNLSDELLVKVADQCLENVSLGVLRRLAEWTTARGPHAREIEDALATLTVPSLYLAATLDPLAPPVSVEAAMAHMPAGYGTFRVISRRRGDGADFGHGDILVSPAAQRAVYPLIMDFIAQRDVPAPIMQAGASTKAAS
jgi:pimeloyl-ACP methyl ester carboxylesterase